AARWAWGGAGTRHGCGLPKGPPVSAVIACRLRDLASAGPQASPCEARSGESPTLGRQNTVRMWRAQAVRVSSELPCLRLALAGFKTGFAPRKRVRNVSFEKVNLTFSQEGSLDSADRDGKD